MKKRKKLSRIRIYVEDKERGGMKMIFIPPLKAKN
jgi:hypothetical protein